ncbi:MAG: undecaprenyl-diphosphate phosphatase [bacterium]
MSWLEALILGLIQGLTEFLPVSSSGHLELGKEVFNARLAASDSLTFDVIVHGGTALSTIVVFWKDIINIAKGVFEFTWNVETRFVALIIISMIPAALIGLVFEDQIEQLFSGQILLVGTMLIITSLLLYLADNAKRTHKTVKPIDAFIIGIAQAIAILPGISRSGSTIATSVMLGISRKRAARFSFLMVLPLIIGKMILDVKGIYETGGADIQISALALISGFLAAFISGLFAVSWMIRLVRKAKLRYFAYYCFLVGLAAIVYYALS